MDQNSVINHKTFCCLLSQIKSHELTSRGQIVALTDFCFHSSMNFTSKWNHILQTMMYDDNVNENKCNVDDCEQKTETAHIVFLVILIVVTILTICNNLLVILAIVWTNLINSNITNIFILSLASSDFFIGIFIAPVKIQTAIHNLHFCSGADWCRFYITADHIFFSVSITNLLVIAVDRYIAINFPYAYPNIMTRRNSKIIVVCTWIYGAMWGLLSNVKWGNVDELAVVVEDSSCVTNENFYYVLTVFILVFSIPVLAMGIIYSRVFYIARRHARDIVSTRAVVLFSQDANKDQQCCSIKNILKGERKGLLRDTVVNQRSQKKRKVSEYRKIVFKASKTVATVYGTFVLAWLPVCLISLILATCKSCLVGHERQWYFVMLVDLFPLLSSMANPFIYGLMNANYRKSFKYILFNKIACLHQKNKASRDTFTTGGSIARL